MHFSQTISIFVTSMLIRCYRVFTRPAGPRFLARASRRLARQHKWAGMLLATGVDAVGDNLPETSHALADAMHVASMYITCLLMAL